jgi:hypothetical protein
MTLVMTIKAHLLTLIGEIRSKTEFSGAADITLNILA